MISRQRSSLETRLAKTIIGRIDRFRDGKTELASLILELHLFVETYDSGQPELAAAFQEAWGHLAEAVGPFMRDPEQNPEPEPGLIADHLATMERLLRQI